MLFSTVMHQKEFPSHLMFKNVLLHFRKKHQAPVKAFMAFIIFSYLSSFVVSFFLNVKIEFRLTLVSGRGVIMIAVQSDSQRYCMRRTYSTTL